MKMSDFFSDFRKIAQREGFDECGFSKMNSLENHFEQYQNWLSYNYHGTMKWMESNNEFRQNPKNLFPWAISYAIVTLNYHNHFLNENNKYKISKYAILNDYHYVIKKKLSVILSELTILYPNLKYDFFVDSKPVLEKAMAIDTGIGWIGKNNCFIIPKKGSFFFIGGIALNIEYLSENKISKNYCGNCTKCIDACPTNALVKPNVLDSRKCISYLTIEHKVEISEEIQKQMQGNIIGCDICQNVCPHNSKVIDTVDRDLINEKLKVIEDEIFENLTSSEFKRTFKNTPFLRMGFKKLQRNILIAKAFIRH